VIPMLVLGLNASSHPFRTCPRPSWVGLDAESESSAETADIKSGFWLGNSATSVNWGSHAEDVASS
jgi:hypothetical protein